MSLNDINSLSHTTWNCKYYRKRVPFFENALHFACTLTGFSCWSRPFEKFSKPCEISFTTYNTTQSGFREVLRKVFQRGFRISCYGKFQKGQI